MGFVATAAHKLTACATFSIGHLMLDKILDDGWSFDILAKGTIICESHSPNHLG